MGDVVFFFKAESTIVAFCFRKKKKKHWPYQWFSEEIKKSPSAFQKAAAKTHTSGNRPVAATGQKTLMPPAVSDNSPGRRNKSISSGRKTFLSAACCALRVNCSYFGGAFWISDGAKLLRRRLRVKRFDSGSPRTLQSPRLPRQASPYTRSAPVL